ncbi:MAG TPA: hypothetical protein VIN59_08315 [Alphaproteobacteria bacterium]
MNRRGFLRGMGALLAGPAMPGMMGARAAEAALEAFPSSIGSPDGHYLGLVLQYFNPENNDFLWRLPRATKHRFEGQARSWANSYMHALSSWFAKQTSDLEFIAGFTDQAIQEHFEELIHPRDWTGTPFEKDTFSRDRIHRMLQEDGDRNDLLRALRSKDSLRAYIERSRTVMEDVADTLRPYQQRKIMPLEPDHICLWYRDDRFFHLGVIDEQREVTADELVDWRDPKALNWLIEQNHIQDFGSRLNRYELPQKFTEILDGFEDTTLFRYNQWWRQRHWAKAAAPFRESALGRPVTDAEHANFKDIFIEGIKEYNERFNQGGHYDDYHTLLFPSVRREMFDEARTQLLEATKQRRIPAQDLGTDFEINCLFQSGEVSFVNTDDAEGSYRLHFFEGPRASDAKEIVKQTLIRAFKSVTYVHTEQNGDLLIAPHPAADLYAIQTDRVMLERWATMSKRTIIKDLIDGLTPPSPI